MEVTGQRFLSNGWVGRMNEKTLLWPNVGLVSYSCNNGTCYVVCTDAGAPTALPISLELDGLFLEMVEVNGHVFALLQQFNKRNTSKYRAVGKRFVKRKPANWNCMNERKVIMYELVYPFVFKEISEWDFDQIYPLGFVQNGIMQLHGLAVEWNCKKRSYDLYMVDLIEEKFLRCHWKEFDANDQKLDHSNLLHSNVINAPILIRSVSNKQSKVLYSLDLKMGPIENIHVPLIGTEPNDARNQLTPNLWYYHESLSEKTFELLYYWKSNNYKDSFFQLIKISETGQIILNLSQRIPYELTPIYGAHSLHNQIFNMSVVASILVPDSSTYISIIEENGKFICYERTTHKDRIIESRYEIDNGPEYSGFLFVWQINHLANYSFNLFSGEIKLSDTSSKSLKLGLFEKGQRQLFYTYNNIIYSR